VSQQTTNRSFDELARAMAEGSLSRRGALKLFAGTALAALIPSRALADDDDDDCVRVCHVPFDRETEECDFAKAETRCVSRSRRRRHLKNHPCDCRGRCRNCLTPECQDFGVECTANDQCCSGRCAPSQEIPGIRTCNDPCPVGFVTLSNAACAVPCTTLADCVPPGGTISNCDACSAAEADTGQGFCSRFIEGEGTPCPGGTIDCPETHFCLASTGVCGAILCTPEL
jgi:hypothetical protein